MPGPSIGVGLDGDYFFVSQECAVSKAWAPAMIRENISIAKCFTSNINEAMINNSVM